MVWERSTSAGTNDCSHRGDTMRAEMIWRGLDLVFGGAACNADCVEASLSQLRSPVVPPPGPDGGGQPGRAGTDHESADSTFYVAATAPT